MSLMLSFSFFCARLISGSSCDQSNYGITGFGSEDELEALSGPEPPFLPRMFGPEMGVPVKVNE